MQPGDGLIQARLVAVKQLRLDLFLGGMLDAPRAGPDLGAEGLALFLAALIARVGHLDGGDDIAHTALCPGIRVAVVEPVIDRECVKHGRHLFLHK